MKMSKKYSMFIFVLKQHINVLNNMLTIKDKTKNNKEFILIERFINQQVY